ncbi:unnamed protein product, partial [Protopolystoma xenopodis]
MLSGLSLEIDNDFASAVNRQAKTRSIQQLFEGKRFFLSREVPREVITLILRACGGQVSWEAYLCPGATFSEEDISVDYHILDRPLSKMKPSRFYVQPQWVFDSLNSGRLLPGQDYLPGVELPAHLSPFSIALQNETSIRPHISGGLTSIVPGMGVGAQLYKPPEVDYLAGLVSLAETRGSAVACSTESRLFENIEDSYAKNGQNCATQDIKKAKKRISSKSKIAVLPGHVQHQNSEDTSKNENAELKLREMMLPKRHRKVYYKMKHSIKRRDKEVQNLSARRKQFE